MAKTCGSCEKSEEVGRMEKCGHTVERWCRCSVTGKEHGEHDLCDVADKPRLCEVLGVDVGRRFKVNTGIEDELPVFYIDGDGSLCRAGNDDRNIGIFWLLLAINHPERIERVPRLTPEEVQRCRAFGAKWVSRDNHRETVDLWEEKPRVIPTELKCGTYGSAKRCAQTWTEYFPSVRPGQLIQVEDEPSEGAAGQ